MSTRAANGSAAAAARRIREVAHRGDEDRTLFLTGPFLMGHSAEAAFHGAGELARTVGLGEECAVLRQLAGRERPERRCDDDRHAGPELACAARQRHAV